MSRPCRAHIVDAGFPQRTALILAREEGLFLAMVGHLRAVGDGVLSTAEPGFDGGVEEVTVDTMLDALGERDGPRAIAAAFLAGHCELDDTQRARALGALGRLVDDYDPARPSSASVPYAYAGLSLALLGEPERAMTALRPLVDPAGPRSMGDALAAFHLAQLGDPSGYPLMVALLGAKEGFYRSMAARHLAGFLPYEGRSVDGHTVGVVERLTPLLDDKDDLVAVEIPGLLAEADPVAARSILERAAKKARDKATRRAAADTLARLG